MKKYNGKYSLTENLVMGRGMRLLKEGSTVWGNGWLGEVAVTKLFGGTLKPNHLVGNHSPARSTEDALIPTAPGNEVKQLMQPSHFGISRDECVIPIELSATRMSDFDAGSPTAQFKRWAKRGGAWDEWQSGIYDPQTKKSTPSGELGNRDEVAASMGEYLEEHIFVVDTAGQAITVWYFKNATPKRVAGMRQYNTADRPAANVVLDLNGATETKTISKSELKTWLAAQPGMDPSASSAF